MAVDTPLGEYSAALPKWERCRDAADGQECVHAKGEEYLPKLGGQSKEEYAAYRGRALYYNATGRTVDGLSGLIFRKPPQFVLPAEIGYLEDDVDTAGTPLLALSEQSVDELIKVGRFGLLADFPVADAEAVRTKASEQASGLRPYLTMRKAESVINWQLERVNNRAQFTLVVLLEEHQTQVDDYSWKTEPQIRALRLVEGKYLIEIHRKVKSPAGETWQIVEVIVPLLNNAQMDFIPFLFCAPMGVSEKIDKPPILDLANVNLSHYKSTADYEHGLHFTALPTPIVTGHEFDATDVFNLGSTKVQAFREAEAKVFYLEFQGEGLGNLSKRLEEKEAMMASLGARMLAAEKRAAEAAETAAIHRSGENSVLASLANAASAAITKGLQWCADWVGAKGEVSAKLNTDYMPAGMTSQDMTALVAAWQAGGISHDTLLDNMQRGEVLPQDVTIDQEKALIEAEGPPLGSMVDPTVDPITGLPKKPAPTE